MNNSNTPNSKPPEFKKNPPEFKKKLSNINNEVMKSSDKVQEATEKIMDFVDESSERINQALELPDLKNDIVENQQNVTKDSSPYIKRKKASSWRSRRSSKVPYGSEYMNKKGEKVTENAIYDNEKEPTSCFLADIALGMSYFGIIGCIALYFENLLLGILLTIALVFLVIRLYHILRNYGNRKNRLMLMISSFDDTDMATFTQLAEIANTDEQTVITEFRFFIELRFLLQSHIDLQNHLIFLTDESYAKFRRSNEQNNNDKPIKIPQENTVIDKLIGFETFLQGYKIRPEDAKIKEEVDQLSKETEMIIIYLKEQPESISDFERMAKYYLPMIKNVLEDYRLIDSDKSSKSVAADEIAESLSKINNGFKKLYDQVCNNAAMNIHADISVLDQLLEKDGLSDNNLHQSN